MRTVASPIRFATAAISRSKESPSDSWTISGLVASGSPSVSVGRESITVLPVSGWSWWWCPMPQTLSLEAAGAFIPSSAAGSRASANLRGSSGKTAICSAMSSASSFTQPISAENGKLDPGVIGPVPGCPDDCVDLQFAPVLEAHGPPFGVDNAGFQLHAIAAAKFPRAGADQRLSISQLPTEPRFDGCIEETGLRQPPEEIAAKQSLRERRLPRADGKHNPAGVRQLLGDLEPRVAAADDEHRTFRHVRGFAVTRAVRLEDFRLESARHFRDERFLEWSGGDNNLLSGDS